MSTVSAARYGSHVTRSNYGDRIESRNGNGDTYNELHVEVAPDANERLGEIQAMYNEIAQSPLPGDEWILQLLKSEQKVIESYGEEDFESILDTYPDLPAYITDKALHDTELRAEIAELAGGDDNAALSLAEEPAEYFAQLSQSKSLKVLHALQDSSTRDQEQMMQAMREQKEKEKTHSLTA